MEATLTRPKTVKPEGERVDLPITGMTCAACANRIERSLGKQPGVKSASVNFATERATITFDPAETNAENLIGTVRDVGYDVAEQTDNPDDALEAAHATEYAEVKRKFWVAALLSLPVLVIAMPSGSMPPLVSHITPTLAPASNAVFSSATP